MAESKLKKLLIKIKNNNDIVTDPQAQQIIEVAIESLDKKIDLQKVVFVLKQDINMYSVSHGFKLPETLTKLQLVLNKDVDKWNGAGITLSLTNF